MHEGLKGNWSLLFELICQRVAFLLTPLEVFLLIKIWFGINLGYQQISNALI